MPWHILAPSAVACDNLHLRASAHHWHVSAFLCNRKFQGISYYTKNRTAANLQQPCIRFPIFEKRLVVDQLIILVVPAVKLTDLCADFLRRMLGSKLSHSLEVYLTTCRGHIQ